MKDWELTAESFNLLLDWLDADRDLAAQKYEDIRRRLIVLFEARGCATAEDLADETINRVARRLPAMVASYVGSPAPYFYTVARRLYLEQAEKQCVPLPADFAETRRAADGEGDGLEEVYECLEKCLGELEPETRELVVLYYLKEKQDGIDFRKALAERMGLAVNALRIRMHRARARLHACLDECLARESPPEMK
jgi:RNA polymerase sigma factor (sigma-70 family)